MINSSRKLPKISIITPSYNQGKYLEETIQSVLTQDYPNLEYIIIDGGSTDNSVDIIKKYSDKLAFWVSEPDRGQSHAINKGIARATGEIINWINSDDLLCTGALVKVGLFFLQNPDVDLCYGNNIPIDRNGKIITMGRGIPFSKKILLSGITLPQQSTFFRRYLIEKYGSIDESLNLVMDYELYLRFAFNNCQFGYIKTSLGKFRYYDKTKSNISKLDDTFSQEKKAVQIWYLKRNYGTSNVNILKKWYIKYNFYRWIINIDNYILRWRFYLDRIINREIGKTFKG